MAVNIKLKRSSVSGNIPTTAQVELGEVALNTYDGRAFMKRKVGATETIVEFVSSARCFQTSSICARSNKPRLIFIFTISLVASCASISSIKFSVIPDLPIYTQIRI